MSLRLHLCFLIVPLTIMGLVKDLKLLTPFSSISNVVTLFGFILVFFYLIEDDVIVDEDKLQIKGFKEIPFFIGTTLFALEAVGVVKSLLFLTILLQKKRKFFHLSFNVHHMYL